MKQIAIILLYLGFTATLQAQEDAAIDSAVNNIAKQLLAFPQEKIYLQTDKPYYITGEKIFFRAFLLDAFSNWQDTLSRYVYVELINPADSVAQRVKIRRDSTYMFYGAIPLREDLPQGNYKIRAYTRYMQNQGESSFFTKQVKIGDPQMLKEKTVNSQYIEQPDRDFDVSFYPEGGQLIAGQSSNVAFKALSADGTALNITGKIIDSKGNTVAQFKTVHDGMGDFFINPLPDEHYRAIIRVQGERQKVKEIDLPEAQKNTFSLKTLRRENKLWITVNKYDSASFTDLYLLIHSSGSIVYAKAWDSSKDFVILDKSIFPSGVSHIILLTKDFRIVSERLIFILNDDNGTATFQTNKDSYHKREQVISEIQIRDEKQNPLVAGNFSIAVTNDKEVVPDTTLNILSSILLSSELRGKIDNPAYYFQKGNKDAERAVDLLMRTQGWTRYTMPDVVQGKLSYPQIPFEQSQEISGSVKSGLILRTAKNFKVSLMSLNHGFFDLTETDKSGRYTFKNFEFPDSTGYMIQALNKRGGGGEVTNLYVDEDTFPEIHLSWIEPMTKEEKKEPIFMDYVAKADRQYTYENGKRIVNLPEVEVKGIYKDKERDKYKSLLYSDPDYSFSSKDIEKYHPNEVKNLLYMVPGVLVTNSGNVGASGILQPSIRIRGAQNAPLIVIDGTPMISMGNKPNDESNAEALNMINVNDIGQIDVLTSVSKSAMYGSMANDGLGSNGVIVIYTKRGESTPFTPSENIKSITPLGYQLPVEFYSPKYDTQEKIDNQTPDLRTTIYWKPNVITDNEGNAKLDFYTADDPGTYSVVIEGVSGDGKLIHYLGRAAITVNSDK